MRKRAPQGTLDEGTMMANDPPRDPEDLPPAGPDRVQRFNSGELLLASALLILVSAVYLGASLLTGGTSSFRSFYSSQAHSS
jgi:hypothetical protein